MHAVTLRQHAIALRKQGYSYPYISKQTGLSKSTLSGWLTDLAYKPNAETFTAFGKAKTAASMRKGKIRQESMEKIRAEAVQMVGELSSRDVFMFGIALYLGEGSKTANIVRIANADPAIIFAAVKWFKDLGVDPSQFAVRIHLYPDNDIEECTLFWSGIVGISPNNFMKPSIDMRSNKSFAKKGKLPHGTLHLGIRSGGKKKYGVLFSRMIQAWCEAVVDQITRN